MTRRHGILLVALLVAGYLALWGNEPAAPAQAAALPVPPARTALPSTASAAAPQNVARLIPREQLMQDPSDGKANPFANREAPPPPAPVIAAVVPTQAPLAPPLPFQFIGKKLENGQWEIYLDAADQTLIVHKGDTLLGRYRVDEIHPPNLLLTYLPLDQRQTLVIGQGEE